MYVTYSFVQRNHHLLTVDDVSLQTLHLGLNQILRDGVLLLNGLLEDRGGAIPGVYLVLALIHRLDHEQELVLFFLLI